MAPQREISGAEERRFILSNQPPSAPQKRLAALIVVGLFCALYLVVGPFGGIQLGAIHSFVAVYSTAMFVTDSITAILLYAQFSILRSRAILVIASGYLFTALLIVPYVLAFPGVLAPGGLVGSLQTSATLYLIWHCGFPLFVVAYALTKDGASDTLHAGASAQSSILWSVALTVALATTAAVFSIKGGDMLPRIMLDTNQFVPNWLYVVGLPITTLCFIALSVLWVRRRSILDLYLMVILFAYMVEVPPHYYPRPERFSTGWYAVRVTGFVSSSILLVVLLWEITTLYGGLLAALRRERREREARLMTGDAVAATIAHEIRQPLTAMVTTADAGLRFLERGEPNLDRAKKAFSDIALDGHRAGAMIANIRANFKSDVQQVTNLDLGGLLAESLALGRSALQRQGVEVSAIQNAQLPEVMGNRVQLQQVLINLITNAADAMADKVGPRTLTVRSERHGVDRVLVSIADTGDGIHPAHSDLIFKPLFTTKPDGMGMGLSICRAIVEAHKGEMWFTPNVPRGAVFQFTLPTRSPAEVATGSVVQVS